MSLADVQRVLARLYTDTELRERFLGDPEATAAALGLDPADCRTLAGLQGREIRRFVRSLQRKRLDEAAGLLPLTHRALGPAFDEEFLRFAETFQPRGVHRHREDACAFSAFLFRRCVSDEVRPPWAGELARYEAGWLEMTAARRRVLVLRFRYPVGEIVRMLQQEETPGAVPPRPCWALWLRIPGDGPLRHTLRHTVLCRPTRGPRQSIAQ